MKFLLLVLLGCLPLTFTYAMILFEHLHLPYFLAFLMFLLIWAALGAFSHKLCGKKGLLLLNFPAFVMLLWAAAVIMIPNISWPDLPSFVHSTPVNFYISFVAASSLYRFIHSTLALYGIIFILLLLSSFLGFMLYKKFKT